jgi:hypothetical protein
VDRHIVDRPGPRAPIRPTPDAPPACPGCRGRRRRPLVVLQPFEDQPALLIGACRCGALYRIRDDGPESPYAVAERAGHLDPSGSPAPGR